MTEQGRGGIPWPGSSRLRKRIAAGLIAILLLFATPEILYRAFWAARGAWAVSADKSGYFALYMVGESTAAGEPYDPGITPSGLVTALFGGRLGGRNIREFNLAKPGESAYPQAVAFEHALRLRNAAEPGAVLVYTGNNDAGSTRGMPALEWLRENILSRSMLLRDLLFYAEKRFRFLGARTPDTYEYQLRRIVEMSLKSGLVPVLSTVPSNISDIDPGLFERPDIGGIHKLAPGQFRRPVMSGAEMRLILEKGRALEASGRAMGAVPYYSGQAGEHPPMRAYLTYRMGKSYQALGRYETAAQYYREAVDLGGPDNFHRATSLQNDFIRSLAKQYSIPLVDAVEIFKRNSPHGLVGSGLFSDGHHPNIKGYLLLTGAYAEKLSGVFKEPLRRGFSSPEEVFKLFSYGRDKQAAALITSGRWLFNVAMRHVCPGQRLKMAGECFKKAILLEPDNFSAWLALGLAETAVRGALISGDETISWLAEQGLGAYHGWEYHVTPAQLKEILDRLVSYGLPVSLAEEISRKAVRHFNNGDRPHSRQPREK